MGARRKCNSMVWLFVKDMLVLRYLVGRVAFWFVKYLILGSDWVNRDLF